MYISDLTGPVIHVGVPGAVALIFRLSLIVAIFCGILPDMVDKPLAVLGIGGGRYIGHTLLFSGLVVAGFTLWKKKYGLAALIGLASHLLLDLNTMVPWFYPFRDYQFNTNKLNIIDLINSYLTFSQAGLELLVVGLVCLVAFICFRLYRRYNRPKRS